mmetsp:Transcript_8462/g.9451  ORF Transcript_8462/g.9451 Transcript_8462/m.9451 type:complete len:553 (+) Transcript_8462:3-1661(+)
MMEQSEEPPAKRLKVALEPFQEPPIEEIREDGDEKLAHLPTPDEKFGELVRYLRAKKEKEGKEEKDEEEDNEWRIKLDNDLVAAEGEATQMVQFIQVLKERHAIGMTPVLKPPALDSKESRDIKIQVTSKKKHLSQASEKLSMAATRLGKLVDTDSKYFNQVLCLRKYWRIIAPPQAPNNYEPIFWVDYSLSQEGSKFTSIVSTPIKKTEDGDIFIELKKESYSRALQVCHPRDKAQLYFDRPVTGKAVGVNACNSLLKLAQWSLFSHEVFSQLANKDSLISTNPFLMQVNQNEVLVENTDGNSIAFRLGIRQNKDSSAMDVDEPTNNTEQYSIYKSTEILLYRLQRESQKKRLKNANRIFLSTHFAKQEQKEKDTILYKVIAYFYHICQRKAVDKLLTSLRMNCTYLSFTWLPTEKSCVACLELCYSNKILLCADLIEGKIRVQGVQMLHGPLEFIHHVQQRLCNRILQEALVHTKKFYKESRVISKSTEMSVRNTGARVQIVPGVDLNVKIRCIKKTTNGKVEEILLEEGGFHGSTPDEKILNFFKSGMT